MTIEELQALYRRCYRIIQKERMMRMAMKERAMNEAKASEWERKIAEMDLLLADVTAMKDALKEVVGAKQLEQGLLLDIPAPVKSLVYS